MKVIFKNGTELSCLRVEEAPVYYDNANRRALTVEAARTAISLDDLDALLANSESTTSLRVTNEVQMPVCGEDGALLYAEDGTPQMQTVEAEDRFEHYSLLMEMAAKPVAVGIDEFGGDITESRIVFKLGRLTPIEIKLAMLGLL